MLKVRNMISERSDREVANQFVITSDEHVYMQSYSSLVVDLDYNKNGNDWVVTFGHDWDYSRTTMKYVNQFIRQYLFGFFNKNNLEISAKGIRTGIEKGILKYNPEMI